MRRALLLALCLLITEALEPRQGQAAGAGTDGWYRDGAASVWSEVTDLLDEFVTNCKWHNRMHRKLLPVVAGVEPARNPPEGLPSSLVRRAGAGMKQVDRVSFSPSSTPKADDEGGAILLDSRVSVPLGVTEDARQAGAVSGAVLRAALFL